jgi:hypothetical protein
MIEDPLPGSIAVEVFALPAHEPRVPLKEWLPPNWWPSSWAT